jgi:hypothetical protein
MNRTVLSLALFLITSALSAQQVLRLTETPYNRPASVSHIVFTSDTTYLSVIADSAIGTTFPSNMGNMYIDHRNLQGDLLWRYSIKGQVAITSILYDALGNTLFTGAYTDTLRIGDSTYANGDPFDSGSLFGKLNAAGQPEWVIVEDSFGDDANTSVTAVPNGYMVSSIHELSGGAFGFYNESGDHQWSKALSFGVRTTSSILYNVFDQSIYLTGDCEPFAQFDTINVGNPPSTGYLSYLARFDVDGGDIYWVKTAPFVTFDLGNKLALNGHDVFLFEGIDTSAMNLNISYRLSSVSSDGSTLSRLLPTESFNVPIVNFDRAHAGIVYKDFTKITAVVYDSVLNKKYESVFSDLLIGFEVTACAIKKDMMFVGGTFYTDSFTLGDKTIYPDTSIHQQSTYLALIKNDPLTTGLMDQNEKSFNDIVIYPNPASDKVYIYSPAGKTYIVSLIDFTGRVIISGDTKTGIDIANTNPGLYIIDVCDSQTNAHSYQKLLVRK